MPDSAPMRFLVSALGSAGDVHPFVAIARSLAARGHAVRMIASPHFEARIRAAGVAFVQLGSDDDYLRILASPDLWHPVKGARLVLDELLAHLPEAYAVTDAAARDDRWPATSLAHGAPILVGSSLSWAMRLVAERSGHRSATVHLSPTLLQSASRPAVMPGIGDLSWLPRPVVGLLQAAVDRLLLDRAIAPRLDRLRATLGLPPVRRVWSRWMHSPDLVVGAWPGWFAPTQPDWPPNTVVAGFPLFDEAVALDPALAAFLDAGPPPVGITPGSAMAHGRRFIERALDAAMALGRRALVITPFAGQLPARLPDGAHHVAYAPFTTLLPRLSLLVHHGGIGTSAQALAAGLPQVVAPFAHDQFDNAARLRRLGVATVVSATASPSTWADTLREAATSTAIANDVRAMAARLASDGSGADRIAELLERPGP